MTRPGFPRSLPDFMARFPSEEACCQYVIRSRWPDGFECPGCGHTGPSAYQRGGVLALECPGCRKVISATSGTVMHRSRQSLRTWLTAAFLLVTDKRGISATQLQRALGIKRYETAYQMLHKLRAGMVAPQREQLRGRIEVDETYVGGRRKGGKRSRGAEGKSLVVGAAEMRGKKPNRIRLAVIRGATKVNLIGFIESVVAPASEVVTDALDIYVHNVPKAGFRHTVESTARGMDVDSVLPGLHLVFSNLKAWLQGTFHGAVREKHLQAYLNEFVFRYNRRANLHAAFQTVLGIGTSVPGPTYSGLYEGTWVHPNPIHGRRRSG